MPIRKLPYIPVQLKNGFVVFCTRDEYRKLFTGPGQDRVTTARPFDPRWEDEEE
jgi:hypothetical protein